MKKNGINANHYYQLLDWKDKNLNLFHKWFKGRSLNSLSVDELNQLDELIQKQENKPNK